MTCKLQFRSMVGDDAAREPSQEHFFGIEIMLQTLKTLRCIIKGFRKQLLSERKDTDPQEEEKKSVLLIIQPWCRALVNGTNKVDATPDYPYTSIHH